MEADGPPGVRYVRHVSLAAGTRVVVRHREGTGVTDVLGVLEDPAEDPAEDEVRVRRRDGSLAVVPLADVVAMKAVPPPPERRR